MRSEIQFTYIKALSNSFSKVFERVWENFFQKVFPKENQSNPIPSVSDYFFAERQVCKKCPKKIYPCPARK